MIYCQNCDNQARHERVERKNRSLGDNAVEATQRPAEANQTGRIPMTGVKK